jgi:hypothetical protein
VYLQCGLIPDQTGTKTRQLRDHSRIYLYALRQAHSPCQLEETAILTLAKRIEIDWRPDFQFLGFFVDGHFKALDGVQRI